MKKTILIILDGWGIAKDPSVSAIDKAYPKYVKSLLKDYPNSTLEASGLAVGLPQGQMGNSEVGHLNIGGGRIVYQMLVRIQRAIEDESFYQNSNLLKAIAEAKTKNKNLHLIGLLSDGGVHSHNQHLYALLRACKKQNFNSVFIHAFTDGRDTDPHAGAKYVEELQAEIDTIGVGKIASICGRYYAMDRDHRWERIKKCYDLMLKGTGVPYQNAIEGIRQSYKNEITDEFIEPIVITDEIGNPIACIQEDDVVLHFNFRTDRGREITMALTQKNLPNFKMKTIPLYYVTMTRYDEEFKGVDVLFETENLKNTLGEVLAQNKKTQTRAAETEKYPHVTFFFSGGREEEFSGERRIMQPSPKVATYDLQPQMSALELMKEVEKEIKEKTPDFICLNFANLDMVGHTGNFDAVVKACEVVDLATEYVVRAAQRQSYSILIIADHGNAEYMINPDGSPHTAHTTNLVPCILIDKGFKGTLSNGKLGNVAPTILDLMRIKKPAEMTEESLLVHSENQN